jgi:L-asparaginase II
MVGPRVYALALLEWVPEAPVSVGEPPMNGPNHGYPDNPILVRVWRGDSIESVHRGAWVLVDTDGAVVDGAGAYGHPVYARSTIKSVQALPLLETGAAERFGFGEREVALAMSSHNAEACHTDTVSGMLARAGVAEDALRCGAQAPGDPAARAALRTNGGRPRAIHNNCSGKHAGFLALARHLDEDPARYLDPTSAVQTHVRRALGEMCGVEPASIPIGVDGCSAPTFRVPLASLARAFARFASPDALAPERAAHCRRMLDAAAAHPELIAGNHKRIDTDILRATHGRLFAKVGAEAVYLLSERDSGRALAIKVDDGQWRGMHRLVLGLIERLHMAGDDELEALGTWRDPVVRNHAGLEVGREEVMV